MVMINNRLQQLSGDELVAMLRAIPASSIQKIEVITAPPARYDAAGNAGIINIVTKKPVGEGLNGNIAGSWLQRQAASQIVTGNFNYRRKALNIYGNMNMAWINVHNDINLTTFYPEQYWIQRSPSDIKSSFYRAQIGLDYQVGPRSVLGFQYMRGAGYPNERANIVSTGYQYTGIADSSIVTRAHSVPSGERHVINANYEWRIDSVGRKLNIDFDYFTRTGEEDRRFTVQNEMPDHTPVGALLTNHTAGKMVFNIASLKADMEWPTRLAELSFGGKISFIDNSSNTIFRTLYGDHYVVNPNRSNDFKYRENTQAVYLSATRHLQKWEMQAGLRAEYTQTGGRSPTLQQTNTNRYFQLFPTAYVQYRLSDDHIVNVNYNRRIDRPTFWYLNPFRSYSTNDSYEEGNPFLQPSFANNLEISYTLKEHYNFSIYRNKVTDMVTRVSNVDSTLNALYFTMTNAGSDLRYGFTASANGNPANWWNASFLFNGYYVEYVLGYYQPGQTIRYSGLAWSVTATNSFFLDKTKSLSAEVNYRYQSNRPDDFDLMTTTSNFDIGIRKALLQKRLTVALSANDLFRKDIFRLKNRYNGTRNNSYYDERFVKLYVGYKFGNNQVKAKRARNAGADEAQRAQ
ncbi:TonB-dependent receptor [Chitinophaga sedimenti]|uniref:outer membrane beta-barrel family protein n=1 Tax=Chitinophaga sedimenti TaxID=2033606 RepID=UPI00200338BE|nr:outer membrane beta-barrel family protein [Chitinophaga sedimenti]MCK7556632.1 TonB-dependent receptor [Chitinophaga sedimenti]